MPDFSKFPRATQEAIAMAYQDLVDQGLPITVPVGLPVPKPVGNIYALSATRAYPAASTYTYETKVIQGSSYGAVCVVRAETGYVDDPTLPAIIIEGRNFRNDTGNCVHVYMPNGREVIFQYCKLAGKSAADFINVTDNSNVTIRYNIIEADGSQPIGTARGRAFYAFRPRNVKFEYNYLRNTAGGKIEYFSGAATASDTILWRYNRYNNICGGTGGDYRQGLQVQHVTQRPGMEIAYNQIENAPGASRVEDNFNLGESNGTTASPPRVHHNYVRGAYPANPTDGGFTGTGITTDAGSQGVTVANGPNGWLVEDNWLVACMNSCMNIAAGRDNKYRRNKIVVSGKLADGRRLNGVNNAVSIFRGQPYSTEQFDGNEITGNDIFVNSANGENHYYENSLDPGVSDFRRYVGPNSKALVAGNTLNTYRDGATYADEQATLKDWQAYLTANKIQVGVPSK